MRGFIVTNLCDESFLGVVLRSDSRCYIYNSLKYPFNLWDSLNALNEINVCEMH